MQNILEKVEKNFDLSVAVLMGFVTVFTAFAVFCASLWGSTSIANYSKANKELNEANTTYLEYVTTFVSDDLRELRLINGGMSEKEAETETQEATKEVEILLKEYEESKTLSDEHLQLADVANANGDKFQLVAVILATILFLASMSLSAKDEKIKKYFFIGSSFLLFFTLLYFVTLPFPF